MPAQEVRQRISRPRTAVTPLPALLLALLASMAVGAAEPPNRSITVRYVDVDAPPGGDGTSWALAFNALEDALTLTQSGDEVWVAEGTYRPSSSARGAVPSVDPTATFTVPDGVHVSGGFAGTETSVEEADPDAHRTILSGDLASDDIDPDSDGLIEHYTHLVGTNAYHVLTVGPPTRGGGPITALYGLVVTAGHSLESGGDDGRGAAIRCNGTPLVASRLTVQGNRSEDRAALWNCGLNFYGSVNNSQFINNYAGDVGAVAASAGVWRRCLFEGNDAGTQASVFYIGSGTLEITNSIFRGNQQTGAAPIRLQSSSAHIENVLFVGNTSSASAMELSGSLDVEVVNSTFVGNHSVSGKGAIWVEGSSGNVDVVNSIFWGNDGGVEPVGPGRGGGGDVGIPIGVSGTNAATVTVSYSNVQNSYDAAPSWVVAGVTDGGNNSDVDPLFVDVADATTAPFTYANVHLLPGSPMLDAGDNAASAEALDLGGDARIQGSLPIIDLGVYEGVATSAETSITITDQVTSAVPGEQVEYLITAINEESFPLSVRVLDEFPDDLFCLWEAVPDVPADGPSTFGAGDVDHIQSLSANAEVVIIATCDIDPSATGLLVNSAMVEIYGDVPYYEDDSLDNVATDDDTVLTPMAELSLSYDASGSGPFRSSHSGRFFAGDEIVYAITVGNSGPSDDPEAQVVAMFPSVVENCMTQCLPSPDRGLCNVDAGLDALVSISGGGGTSVLITCTVKSDAPLGEFSSDASVTASVAGDNPKDNGATLVNEVVAPSIFEDGFEGGTTGAWSGSTG